MISGLQVFAVVVLLDDENRHVCIASRDVCRVGVWHMSKSRRGTVVNCEFMLLIHVPVSLNTDLTNQCSEINRYFFNNLVQSVE